MANTTLTQTGAQVQADLDKVEGLANIKSVGSGLSLSSAGQLSASGGSSIPKVTIQTFDVTVTIQLYNDDGTGDYTWGNAFVPDAGTPYECLMLRFASGTNATGSPFYGGYGLHYRPSATENKLLPYDGRYNGYINGHGYQASEDIIIPFSDTVLNLYD